MYKCKTCSKEFDNKSQLGGHSRTHSKKKWKKKDPSSRISSSCINCETIFQFKISQQSGKYCSHKCQQEFQWKIKCKKIENGEIFYIDLMKKYIIHKFGYICYICKNNGNWNNKSLTLQIDHIDGNSDNNQINNLRLLCPNCHSQTETWCSRNVKNSNRSMYSRQYRKRIIKKILN